MESEVWWEFKQNLIQRIKQTTTTSFAFISFVGISGYQLKDPDVANIQEKCINSTEFYPKFSVLLPHWLTIVMKLRYQPEMVNLPDHPAYGRSSWKRSCEAKLSKCDLMKDDLSFKEGYLNSSRGFNSLIQLFAHFFTIDSHISRWILSTWRRRQMDSSHTSAISLTIIRNTISYSHWNQEKLFTLQRNSADTSLGTSVCHGSYIRTWIAVILMT